MVESCVLFDADFNINDDMCCNCFQFSEYCGRASNIVICAPPRWTPSIALPVLQFAYIRYECWERICLS